MMKSFSAKRMLAALCGFLLACAVLTAGCSIGGKSKSKAPATAPQTVAEAKKDGETPEAYVNRIAGPAIVTIKCPVEVNGASGEITGSGVIFHEDGYVVTNDHVVREADANKIFVVMSDGKRMAASLVGTDRLTDIAVLKVSASDLPTVKFADSDVVKKGDHVFAIGAPLGYSGTLTQGIISEESRSSKKRFGKFIQTSTAINPGNSGGPLLNENAEVVGINDWGENYSQDGRPVEGLNFSIPINTAQEVIDQLLVYGYVPRPYLGIVVIDSPTANKYQKVAIEKYNMEIYTNSFLNRLRNSNGVYVVRASDYGSAKEGGIADDDFITAIDGKKTITIDELRFALYEHKIGETVNITIVRNGQNIVRQVTLKEAPSGLQ